MSTPVSLLANPGDNGDVTYMPCVYITNFMYVERKSHRGKKLNIDLAAVLLHVLYSKEAQWAVTMM